MIEISTKKSAIKDDFINRLIPLGQKVTFDQDQHVTLQYMRGTVFYLLVAGELTVSAKKNENEEKIQLGIIRNAYAPIGWSAINPPNRYMVDITVKSTQATLLAFDINSLMERSTIDKIFGIGFFQFVLSRSNHLISEALEHLSDVAPAWQTIITSKTDAFEEVVPRKNNLVKFLQKTPFFEVFEDTSIPAFASICRRRVYRAGDTIIHQGQPRDGFYVLKQGWIDLVYSTDNHKKILYRSISTPGFSISWAALNGSTNYASAIARQTTSVYFFETAQLNALFNEQTSLAFQFFRRMLWLVNHQTQVVRARYLTITQDIEWVAVKTLIEANATRLSLDSQLHEIPHLLQHKHSQKRAFDTLHELHHEGDAHERHLASVALDNLQELSKEYLFYQRLIEIYKSVSLAPKYYKPEKIRSICAKTTIKAFEHVDYRIDGWEKLPEKGGHIFIYNHLKNHPYNTLPNNFQVTLDSHFISSKICFVKYRDAGLRVVRVGKDIEYGHQEYYEKLGHVDVYTADSEDRDQVHTQRTETKQLFFQKAGKYLSQGKNIIISPEGSSYDTTESPGPFKSGAFKLALAQSSEPLIIPLVIANFDKRARYNQFRCRIFEPFKISDRIERSQDPTAMKNFLLDLQGWYKKEVVKLAEL